MSLTHTGMRSQQTGDGSTTTFYYNFLLYDTSHMVVYQAGTLLTTGYTVNGVPGTSTSVTFDTAPALGDQILLLRDVPLNQLSVYAVGGAFPAATTEKNFDLAFMGLQQHSEILDRAVVIPITSENSATEFPDPGLAANYGMGIKIKGDGTGLDTFTINAGDVSSILTTKGDLLTYSSLVDRLPVGTNGKVLQAASGEGTGLKWTGDQPDNVFRVVGSSDSTKKVALEVDGLTTATTRTLTVQDEDGTLALTSEFDYAVLAGSSGRMPLPVLFIAGYTYSNNAGDATNDIDIAVGQCRDATNAHNIFNTATITKRSDAAWVVGTNQGGLDTGAVGNSDYYIWAIKRADTGVCDVLFSLSATAPTMPTDYGFKRLIGWFKRVGGTIVAFTTYETEGGGLDHLWTVPTLDIELLNTLTTADHVDAVKVPLLFSTIAHLNVAMVDGGANYVWVHSTSQTTAAPSSTVAPLATMGNHVNDITVFGQVSVRTSSTGTIASRANGATADAYRVVTLGFTWARRN